MQGLPGVQRSRLRQHDAGSRLESARQRRERQLARVAALESEHGHDRAEHARGHVACAARADVFSARDRGAHRLAARAVQPRRRHPRLQRLHRGGRRADRHRHELRRRAGCARVPARVRAVEAVRRHRAAGHQPAVDGHDPRESRPRQRSRSLRRERGH